MTILERDERLSFARLGRAEGRRSNDKRRQREQVRSIFQFRYVTPTKHFALSCELSQQIGTRSVTTGCVWGYSAWRMCCQSCRSVGTYEGLHKSQRLRTTTLLADVTVVPDTGTVASSAMGTGACAPSHKILAKPLHRQVLAHLLVRLQQGL